MLKAGMFVVPDYAFWDKKAGTKPKKSKQSKGNARLASKESWANSGRGRGPTTRPGRRALARVSAPHPHRFEVIDGDIFVHSNHESVERSRVNNSRF